MKIFAPQSFHVGLGLSSVCFIVSKAIGYARQLILAYHFGISRHLDIYLMTYAITMLVTSSFTLWFDQMAIPRLVEAKEQEGEPKFRQLSASVFSLSVVMGILMCVIFLLVRTPLTWVLAKGFSIDEQAQVQHMAIYFIPWILLIFPYNALTAILKSLRFYTAVSIADAAVSIVSTLGFLIWHSDLTALPLTLAAGYGGTLVVLAFFARHHAPLWGSLYHGRLMPLYGDFKQMFVVNQIVFVGQSFDRFYQSYLLPGSIASYNYVSQIMTPLYELLAFDEIFLVPIASSENRTHKLNRLVSGLLLLTTPLAVFIYFESQPIIQILYQRGKFTYEASLLACRILQILSLGLVVGSLSTPLARALQVANNISAFGWTNVVHLVSLVTLNFIFIFKMKHDVIGLAWAMVCSTYVCVLSRVFLLHRGGVKLHYVAHVKYFIWAFLSSVLCHVIANLVDVFPSLSLDFLMRSVLFAGFLTLCYWPLRGKIEKIIYGNVV